MKTCPLLDKSPLFGVAVKREFTVLFGTGQSHAYTLCGEPTMHCILVVIILLSVTAFF